jgi:hypothetical protein
VVRNEDVIAAIAGRVAIVIGARRCNRATMRAALHATQSRGSRRSWRPPVPCDISMNDPAQIRRFKSVPIICVVGAANARVRCRDHRKEAVMKARDVMVRDVITIGPNDSIADAAKLIADQRAARGQ